MSIKINEITSSTIKSIEYRDDFNLLLITFVSGNTYVYKNVEQKVISEFISSPSKGKYFSSNIRGKYEYFKIN